MFHLFTERARRVVFFARYEASALGSYAIKTEHLLLGLLREDQELPGQLLPGAATQIRSRIEAAVRHPIEHVPTSVDLPLSRDAQRVLAYAHEESERLQDTFIDCDHLVLALLRVECAAADLLREFGADYIKCSTKTPETEAVPVWRASEPIAISLASAQAALESLVDQGAHRLDAQSDQEGDRPMKRKPWSRKQALGHLIDWASAHQQWFARALTEPRLSPAGCPAENGFPRSTTPNFHGRTWSTSGCVWIRLHTAPWFMRVARITLAADQPL